MKKVIGMNLKIKNKRNLKSIFVVKNIKTINNLRHKQYYKHN